MTDTPRTGLDSDQRGDGSTTDELTGPDPRAVENPVASQRDDAPLSLEEVFGILRNERRQHVLSYLLLTDEESVELGDLAEHIAAIENDKAVQALTSQERKRVYVALYQCHLPKMADANVVEFEKDRGLIESGPNLDQLEPYLDVPDDGSTNGTPIHYLVLAASGIVAYLLAAVAYPGGRLAGGAVLALGLATFLVISARASEH